MDDEHEKTEAQRLQRREMNNYDHPTRHISNPILHYMGGGGGDEQNFHLFKNQRVYISMKKQCYNYTLPDSPARQMAGSHQTR